MRYVFWCLSVALALGCGSASGVPFADLAGPDVPAEDVLEDRGQEQPDRPAPLDVVEEAGEVDVVETEDAVDVAEDVPAEDIVEADLGAEVQEDLLAEEDVQEADEGVQEAPDAVQDEDIQAPVDIGQNDTRVEDVPADPGPLPQPCIADPSLCDDGNVCTVDQCNPVVGCQHTDGDGQACEDGDACTGNDSCRGGECLGGGDWCVATGRACVPTGGATICMAPVCRRTQSGPVCDCSCF